MNRKGFTLIELLATIIILAMIMGIATYSVSHIIKSAKDKNYDLLISEIKSASEVYYQECRYNTTTDSSNISCNETITLSTLVEYGYIKSNDPNGKYDLINPKDDEDISNCQIEITNNGGIVNVKAVTTTGSCPETY